MELQFIYDKKNDFQKLTFAGNVKRKSIPSIMLIVHIY